MVLLLRVNFKMCIVAEVSFNCFLHLFALQCFKVWHSLGVVSLPSILSHLYSHILPRSPHHDIKVMSVGSLQEKADSAIVWRGPRKTALIKRFVKDTFWGRLDYLIFDILPNCLIPRPPPVSLIQTVSQSASFRPSSLILNRLNRHLKLMGLQARLWSTLVGAYL